MGNSINFYYSYTYPYGTGSDFAVKEINVHENGEYTLLGTFKGTYDFDPINNFTLTSNFGSVSDIFLAQYSSTGNLISAHVISNLYYKVVSDLHITSGKKVFVGLGIRGLTDIDPSASFIDPELTGLNSKPLVIEYTTGPDIYTNISDTICNGEIYVLGDLSLTETGKYRYSFPLISGNDSIVDLNLFVSKPSIEVEMVNGQIICLDSNANSYQWYNCELQSLVLSANNYWYSPSDNFSYSVIVEQNNCFDTSICHRITQFSNLGVPEFKWADKISLSNFNKHSLVTDKYDNFYLAGTFSGVTDVELFAGCSQIYQSQSTDLMLMKYNNDGILQWVFTAGTLDAFSSIAETVNAMEVDQFGNVYFTGDYQVSLDFDPDELNTTILASGSTYLAKLNQHGQLLWVKNIGINGNISTLDLAIDKRGNVAIGGQMSNATIDFDPGPGVSNAIGRGFVARYDKLGNFLSVLTIPGTFGGYSPVYELEFGPSDELVIAGRFTGNSDFDPGPNTFILDAGTTYSYTFFASYDSLFNLQWAKRFTQGSTSSNYYFGMVIDHFGQINLCSNSVGYTDFSGGLNTSGQNINSNFMYLVRFNPSGSMIYNYGFSSLPGPISLDLDISGNLYIISNITGSSTTILTPSISINSTNKCTIVAKYLASGTEAYGFKIIDEQAFNHSPDIAVDSKGSFFIASDGHMTNPFDLDPSSNNYFLTSSEGYVAKYGHTCSPINTSFTLTSSTVNMNAIGAVYTYKRCTDNSIVESGVNSTFAPCEENDYYCVIEMGSCIDSSQCFHINPSPSVSISTPTLQICPNEIVSFSATTIQICNPSYQWMINSTPIIGQTNSNFIGSNFQDNDQINCMIIGDNLLDTFLTNTLIIVLLNLPNSDVIVSGDTLATVQIGNTYSWNRCTDNIILQSSNSNTFMTCEEDDYYVIVNSGICIDTSDCFHLIPDIEANINSSNLQVCQNETIYFNATVSQNCVPYYQWYVNGIVLNGENYSTLSTNNLQDNDEVYCIINYNGIQSVQTNSLFVEIFPIPNVSISLSGNALNASPSSNNYSWIDCSNSSIIPGESLFSFTPTSNGSYASIMTDINGCIDTSDCFTYNMTQIQNFDINQINIYPNPSKDVINIVANFDFSNSIISIISPSGMKIETLPFKSGKTINYSIQHLISGFYFVEIINENGKHIFSIIKN
jgi:hypothetical protein